MSKTIAGVLSTLAHKMGVAVTYLWGLMVKQAVIWGYENLAIAAFFALVLIVCIVCIIICVRSELLEKDGDWGFSAGVAVFLSIVSIIMIIICGCHALNDLLNPGYTAFQHVLSQIGG